MTKTSAERSCQATKRGDGGACGIGIPMVTFTPPLIPALPCAVSQPVVQLFQHLLSPFFCYSSAPLLQIDPSPSFCKSSLSVPSVTQDFCAPPMLLCQQPYSPEDHRIALHQGAACFQRQVECKYYEHALHHRSSLWDHIQMAHNAKSCRCCAVGRFLVRSCPCSVGHRNNSTGSRSLRGRLKRSARAVQRAVRAQCNYLGAWPY